MRSAVSCSERAAAASFVFYVQPEYRESVMKAMSDLLYIPFRFEDGGTRVIHYSPEEYVPKNSSSEKNS